MITPLNDIQPAEYFFGMFVGESGAGKTCAEASFPKPILVIDIDKRARGIQGAPWIDKSDIDVLYLKGDDILKELEVEADKWEEQQKKGIFKYKTVILDGFTSLAMIITENAFELTAKMGGTGSKSVRKSQGRPVIGSINLPGLDEFGYEQMGFKNVMHFLKYGLSCNVICSAHWRDVYGKDDSGIGTKVVGKRINLRPAVLPSVAIYFDEVWFFDKEVKREPVTGIGLVDKLKYFVTFRNDLARTAIPELPDGRLDITGKGLWQEVESYIKNAKTAVKK